MNKLKKLIKLKGKKAIEKAYEYFADEIQIDEAHVLVENLTELGDDTGANMVSGFIERYEETEEPVKKKPVKKKPVKKVEKVFVAEVTEYYAKGSLNQLTFYRITKKKSGEHDFWCCLSSETDADVVLQCMRDTFFYQIGSVVRGDKKGQAEAPLTAQRFTQGIRHQIASWCDDEETKQYWWRDIPKPAKAEETYNNNKAFFDSEKKKVVIEK
jgi:hypothetical protein